MSRYLLPEQLKSNLRLGKSVEQWLGHQQEDGYVILKYIAIEKERNGEYSLLYMEHIDEGNESFLDIYDFSYVDPDEPAVINLFDSVEEVLDFALNTYGASLDKYVSAGMIQEEYADYLNER
ncbi:hypothetical protein [Pedobacter heparinus]|uniref:hypothetical protein n=1 Tax=Pedobacter heparinus TaxID=984 RepID=UPI002931CD5E|nr:hypothetical protein [Pedobacter heparinus]